MATLIKDKNNKLSCTVYQGPSAYEAEMLYDWLLKAMELGTRIPLYNFNVPLSMYVDDVAVIHKKNPYTRRSNFYVTLFGQTQLDLIPGLAVV